MNRERLAAILEQHEGEAFVACRQALLAGARFWVAGGSQPASTLVQTYARRDKHTKKRGIETIGFAEAVTKLGALGEGIGQTRGSGQRPPALSLHAFPERRRHHAPRLPWRGPSWNLNRQSARS